jgi:hypothetical protein
VNFDTYIQLEPRESVRHFDPAGSPLRAQWDLLNERVGGWVRAFLAGEGVFLTRGFVRQAEGLFPQYLPAHASVWIRGAQTRALNDASVVSTASSSPQSPAQFAVYALDYRGETHSKRTLGFRVNGEPLEATREHNDDAGVLDYSAFLPDAADLTLEILTLDSDPAGESLPGDELGVHLKSFHVRRGPDALPLSGELAVPPAPLTDARELWSWFYRPAYPHFDFVAWYLYVSGLEASSITILLVAWLLPAGICAAVGAAWLWRAVFRRFPEVDGTAARVIHGPRFGPGM